MAYTNFLEFAKETALEAGNEILMKNYGKMQKMDWNARQHFRTKVDIESDELIRKRIKDSFPFHSIFSEENDSLRKESEFSWVFDPLDGTIPYTFGLSDHFSVAISLAENKNPIIGVIYAPKRQELYFAEKGKGAFCNNKKISVSLEENINHTFIGIDTGKETEKFKRASFSRYFEKLYSPKGAGCLLSSACASVQLCLVASGKLNAYISLSLQPWDMAAAVIINREAGAKVTNISGNEWNLDDESILAANPVFHKNLLSFLKK